MIGNYVCSGNKTTANVYNYASPAFVHFNNALHVGDLCGFQSSQEFEKAEIVQGFESLEIQPGHVSHPWFCITT